MSSKATSTLQSRCAATLVVGMIAWLTLVQVHTSLATQSAQQAKQIKLQSFIPKRTTEELEMDFKMLLHKIKVRQVPLVQINNERILNEKLREKREIMEQIEALERAIENMTLKKAALKTIPASSDRSGGNARRVRFAKIAEKDVEKWRDELSLRQKKLAMVRAQIQESKNIIRHPESYISVPSNYGTMEPSEVQRIERETLLNDRTLMHLRTQIQRRLVELPTFLADKW